MTEQEFLSLSLTDKNELICNTFEVRPTKSSGVTLIGDYRMSLNGFWIETLRWDDGDVPTWYPVNVIEDIMFAWRVVEEMRKDSWTFSITAYPTVTLNNKEYWFSVFSNNDTSFSTTRSTPMLSICITALMAKGIIVDA